jgi:hypothetical protein
MIGKPITFYRNRAPCGAINDKSLLSTLGLEAVRCEISFRGCHELAGER